MQDELKCDNTKPLIEDVAAALRKDGLWYFDIVLDGTEGWEATTRTREGYVAWNSTAALTGDRDEAAMQDNYRTRFLTIIESPYAGHIARNLEYLRQACLDSIARGEVPFASHLFYTQILDDNDLAQRKQGIELGQKFFQAAERIAVYTDYGISPGMKQGIEFAQKTNLIPIEYRRLYAAPA